MRASERSKKLFKIVDINKTSMKAMEIEKKNQLMKGKSTSTQFRKITMIIATPSKHTKEKCQKFNPD